MRTIHCFRELLPSPYRHEYLCIFLHTYALLTTWFMPSAGMWGYVRVEDRLTDANQDGK